MKQMFPPISTLRPIAALYLILLDLENASLKLQNGDLLPQGSEQPLSLHMILDTHEVYILAGTHQALATPSCHWAVTT